MAARVTNRWCVSLVGDWCGMLLAGALGAGFMGFERCMDAESWGMAQRLWGCPLTKRSPQGGIGAAHGFQEKLPEGIGVSPYPTTNSGRIGAAQGPLEKCTGIWG